MHNLALSLSFLALLALSGFASGDPPLRFGLQGAAAEQTLDALWQPILSDLSKTLGRPVEVQISDDYAGIVEALRNGEIQLAWVGNRNAIDAVDRGGAEVFAQVLNSQGVPGYYSLLITHRQRPFNDFDDVWQRRDSLAFAFGDRNSTSGTTVPLYFLFGESGRSHEAFKAYRHADHERNFFDVIEGRVDVATISSVMLQRFRARYPDLADQVKSIWASPLIPTDPLVWRRELDDETKEAVLGFFLGYGQASAGKPDERLADERLVLQNMKWAGFKQSSNSQLAYVRILALFGELEAVRNDTSLDEASRARALERLRERIERAERGLD
jgi:phosphonate transport system substrate-binding protein